MATNYPPPPPGPPGMAPPMMPPDGQPPDGFGPEEMPEAPKAGNRVLIIVLIAVSLLIVSVGVYFFLLKGDDKSTTSTQAGPAASRPPATQATQATQPGQPNASGSPSASPAPSLDPGLSADVSESYQQYSSRNPFKCTFNCVTSTSTTTSTSTSTGGASPSSTPSAQGGSTSGSQEPSKSSAVTLQEIVRDSSSQKAIVKVNGSTYTVAVGETFAGSYKLTRISGSCASFVQGDSPFTLCTGQSVLK